MILHAGRRTKSGCDVTCPISVVTEEAIVTMLIPVHLRVSVTGTPVYVVVLETCNVPAGAILGRFEAMTFPG